MKLERLVVMREGDYDFRTGELTRLGVGQIQGLTSKLVQATGKSRSVVVLTSPRLETVQSAKIVTDMFGIGKASEMPCLVSTPADGGDLDKVLRLVQSRENKHKTIILVTHAELARSFPVHYLEALGKHPVHCDVAQGQMVVAFPEAGNTVLVDFR